MISILLSILRLLPFFVGGDRHLALENLALRHQIAVYRRTVRRPKLRTIDRLFWVGLARVWTDWKHSLVIVTPDTVLRWQRRRFRDYWAKLSGRPSVGRPRVTTEIRASSCAWPRPIPYGGPENSWRTPEAGDRRR